MESKEGFPRFIRSDQWLLGCYRKTEYVRIIESYGIDLSQFEIDVLFNLRVHHETIKQLAWDVQHFKLRLKSSRKLSV